MNTYKDITFCLTLFNPTKLEFQRWTEIFEIFEKNKIEYFALVDNPKLEIPKIWNKERIIYNEKNYGKFESVYNFVKSNTVTTSHIKVCDPDDNLDMDQILNFKFNDYGIIKMKSRYLLNDKEKISKRSSLGNAWTILPIKYILLDEYYDKTNFPIRNWLEDQSLGIISYINGSPISKSNFSWYIYNYGIGMTSKLESDDILEILKTLNSIYNLFVQSNSKPKTKFPGKMKYIYKLFENSNMFPEEKKEKIDLLNTLIIKFKNL